MGRIGTLAEPTERAEVFERIKRELGIGHLLIAGPREGSDPRGRRCARGRAGTCSTTRSRRRRSCM